MKGELQMEPSSPQNPRDSDPLLENQHVDSPSSSSESSSEIKNDDVEAGSVACCRICLECDGEEGAPGVVCTGCISQHCSSTTGYMKLYLPEEKKGPLVIAAMGGFAYVMDKDGTFRNSFSDSWDRILSKHPIPFYYCIGVLAFFVLLGFFGLILHCSSLNSNDPCMAGCQKLLLRMGNFGLFSCIHGSLFRFGHRLCRHICYSWHRLRFPCCHFGHSEDLAETLPHPHQEGTHKGVHSGGSARLLRPSKTGSSTRRASKNA
ncbi:RING/FYVE/PHD zinc finger superfamily protein [Actinidia rufa]|uniref:RING/FYVE/PHD zinc finger superfamily protein n=1 Tax=Actinidia rufa TaxID=165716 RepID=A0A7J0DRS2_9ERIC|nr:RING/FYVE/PHD zinc finger superfamily protein [Actinidia rufa]